MRSQASLESAGSSERGLEKAMHLERGRIIASCRVEETTYQKPVEDARLLASLNRQHVPDWRKKRRDGNAGNR